MSGTSFGTVVLHVAPESAIGGPLALVRTGDEIVLIDRSPASVPLKPGNVILAASDGIHTVSDQEIARVCSESATCDASILATKLLDTVHNANNPKQDNTTIAVIKATLVVLYFMHVRYSGRLIWLVIG